MTPSRSGLTSNSVATRLAGIRRRLILKQESRGVAVLQANLDRWPELVEVVEDLNPLIIQTQNSPIPLLGLPRIMLQQLTQRQKFGWASIAEVVRQSGIHTLVAKDSPAEPLEQIGFFAPEITQLLIGHGSLRHETLLRHYQFLANKHSSRRLLLWGRYDVELIQSVFGSDIDCVPVGSFQNALYMRRWQKSPKLYEIVYVSKFTGRDREASSAAHPDRSRLFALLKSHLRRYCLENGIEIHIALSPKRHSELSSVHLEEERQYYAEEFSGVPLTFTNPSEKFSTYSASDSAEVTIGIPSGSLTESFGRGNSVLMFGQSPETGSHYGFPYEGPWIVFEPSYQEFASRLSQIRMTSQRQFAAEAEPIRKLILENFDSDKTVNLIREEIQKAISKASF